MNRRPWPLVLLAVLQILSPFVSVGLNSYYLKIGYFRTFQIVLLHSDPLDLVGFFIAPILLGVSILYARKLGYYFTLFCASLVLCLNLRDSILFYQQQASFSWMLGGVFLLNLALLAYLIHPSVRRIFMDSKIRWWESKPRFFLNIPVKISGAFHGTLDAVIEDISIGGSGLLLDEKFAEKVHVDEEWVLLFSNDKKPSDPSIVMRGNVVYFKKNADQKIKVGLEWKNNPMEENRKVLELVAVLQKSGSANVKNLNPWHKDLQSWTKRAAKNPSAWFPEINSKSSDKKPTSADSNSS